MLIIDFSGVVHAAYFSNPNPGPIDEGFVRHMILNTIRSHVVKYSKDYGQVVIACDGGSWRRDTFKEYKAKRKKDKEENVTGIDWKEFYRVMNLVMEELRTFFPYKVMRVEGAEADDIIAYFVESTAEFGSFENNMIISSDHDFIQLQVHGNVKQFSPVTKKLLTEKDIRKYAFEQILRGCGSDGVPNFLSDDDAIITEGKRQKPLSSKKVDELWVIHQKDGDIGIRNAIGETLYKNYIRNKMCIDLSCRPQWLTENIADEHSKQAKINPGNSKIMNYLIERKCRQLVSCVEDFFPKKK